MKKLVFLLLLIITANIYAQESNEDLTNFMNENLLKFTHSFFTGTEISQGDNFYSLGYGGSKELHHIFSEYESTSIFAEKFKTNSILGSIFYSTGMAAMTSSLAYTTIVKRSELDPVVSLSLLGGGFITGIIGIIFMDISYTDLMKAINDYNEHIISNYPG